MKTDGMQFRFWNMMLVLTLMLGGAVMAPASTQAQEGQSQIMLPLVIGSSELIASEQADTLHNVENRTGSAGTKVHFIRSDRVKDLFIKPLMTNGGEQPTTLDSGVMDDIEVRDFLIENVCHTPGIVDPADLRCTSHSNIGTTAFYYRTDHGHFQAMHAYGRSDYLGNERIISTMDYRQNSLNGYTLAVHETNYDIDGGGKYWYRDGMNIAEFGGQYASFLGTVDPMGGVQTFYGKPDALSPTCSYVDDAWILFGRDVDATARAQTNYQQINGCVGAFAVPTGYHRSLYTYADGKTLDTIVSEHHTFPAMERQYFTKEYGHTKWESWCHVTHPKGCEINTAVTCAGPNTISDGVRVDGWRRNSCREWTNINPMPTNRPNGYNLLAYNLELPQNEWTTGAVFATTNLLINGDAGFHSTQFWHLFGPDPSKVVAEKRAESIGPPSGSTSAGFMNDNWVFRFQDGAYTFGSASLGSIRPVVWSGSTINLRFGFDLAKVTTMPLVEGDLTYRVDIFDSNGTFVATSGAQNCISTAPVDVWDRCQITVPNLSARAGNLYPAIYITKNNSQAIFYVDDIFVVVEP